MHEVDDGEGQEGHGGVGHENFGGLHLPLQEGGADEEGQDDAHGVEGLDLAGVREAVEPAQLLVAVHPEHEGGGGGEAQADEDDGGGGEAHLLPLALALYHLLKGREGQEGKECAVHDDDDRRREEDGPEGQLPGRHEADGEGQQELGDGDGELRKDIGDGALLLEDLHAGGGDAGIQEGVCHAADHCQHIAHIQVGGEGDAQEEDGVQSAADEPGEPTAQPVREGARHREGDEAAQADGGDDRHHAGDIVAAVRQLLRAPEGGEALLILAHDGGGDAQDEVGDVEGQGRGVILAGIHSTHSRWSFLVLRRRAGPESPPPASPCRCRGGRPPLPGRGASRDRHR